MDDQFGGRTDDDLFADDFEPVVEAVEAPQPVLSTRDEVVVAAKAAAAAPSTAPAVVPPPTTAAASATATTATTTPSQPARKAPLAKGRQHKTKTGVNGDNSRAGGRARTAGGKAQAGQETPLTAQAKTMATAAPPPSLAQSRHNQPDSSARGSGGGGSGGARDGGKGGNNEGVNGGGNRGGGGHGRGGKKGGSGAATGKAEKGNAGSSAPAPATTTLEVLTAAVPAIIVPERTTTAANGLANNTTKATAISTPTLTATATLTPPTGPSTTPSAASSSKPDGGGGGGSNMRLQSGANPRKKLTDVQLNAKMEQMRIASAERAKRFEQAQRDEREHELAMARSQEEARRRKALDEEKRRRSEEDRRRLEEERARNRERKLKAMGLKESSWDEGKEGAELKTKTKEMTTETTPATAAAAASTLGNEGAAPESGAPDNRIPRRGGGGGRGMQASRHAGGIIPVANVPGFQANGNAHANGETSPLPPPSGDQVRGGRGRGHRGGGGGGSGGGRGRNGYDRGHRGRGGRMAFDDVFGNGAGVAEWVQGQPDPSAMAPIGLTAPDLAPDEYPALPPSSMAEPKGNTVEAAKEKSVKAPLPFVPPLSPPIGTWDDEVAAMDEQMKAEAAVAAAAAEAAQKGL